MSVYFSRAECNDLRDARINVVCQAMSESYSLFLFGWALLKFSDIICLTSQTISGWEQPHWLWHRIGLSHRSSASRCWVCVFILPWRKSYPKQSLYGIFPIISIYFPCIYHKNQPSVGKYTIHGPYGYGHVKPVEFWYDHPAHGVSVLSIRAARIRRFAPRLSAMELWEPVLEYFG